MSCDVAARLGAQSSHLPSCSHAACQNVCYSKTNAKQSARAKTTQTSRSLGDDTQNQTNLSPAQLEKRRGFQKEQRFITEHRVHKNHHCSCGPETPSHQKIYPSRLFLTKAHSLFHSNRELLLQLLQVLVRRQVQTVKAMESVSKALSTMGTE